MNAGKWGLLGGGALIALALAAGVLIGVGGTAVAHQDEKERAKTISAGTSARSWTARRRR
jgi:hypothetical protein